MKTFVDETGVTWTAGAREENTPRHHGRWYLVFERGAGGEDRDVLAMPEVQWQTRATAERTLLTMSDFELRRRLHILLQRAGLEDGASPSLGAALEPESGRGRTNVNAG
ncbi:MAG: hypothetical protein WEF86_09845 [Gemmatimonadota bacterium]